jgi:Protein of unknown function (DUF1579)
MDIRRIAASTALIALVSLITSGTAANAATTTARLQAMTGSWSCTYQGPMGSSTSTSTATMLGDHWLKFQESSPAMKDRPAHTGETFFGYDSTKAQWVVMGVNTLGEYFALKSSASPDAMTQTWTDAYPVDPNDGPTILKFASNSAYTLDSTWTEKGKKMSSHQSCTKH